MGFLKKLLRKDTSETEPVEDCEIESQEEYPVCPQCNMAIHPGQKIKSFAGEKIHMKPCWFKVRKAAKNLM